MKKKTAYFSAALVLCTTLLWLLQALLVPKYMTSTREGAMIAEYYDNACDNDVLFIGDCEVYENFSPITLWEQYGITSYIRGSAQQTIWQSYYLLEDTYRYEIPDVVVFNVLSMMYDTPESTGRQNQREAYNRMTLDGMRWSVSKWNAIQASMTEEEKNWEGQFSYLFPLLRYHDRWYQLTDEDFTYWFHWEQVSHNGYLMQTGIKPYTTAYPERPLPSYSFGENSWYYLNKIVELCRENGSQLILIKAPSMYPVWRDQWEEQISQFAAQNGIPYINMLCSIDEIGIDWNTDTYDAGLHLNVYGAEKASSWFGEILSDGFGVADRRDDPAISALWQEKTTAYNTEKELLESTTN